MDMSRRQAVRDSTRYIGERIRHARSLRDVSQSNLGAALGMTFQQVQKYESGKNRVAACTLIAIAEELKLPVSFFLPPTAEPATLSPVELEVVRSDIVSAEAAIDDTVALLTEMRGRLLETRTRLDLASTPTEHELA